MIGSCALVPGMAFKVVYLIWKASRLDVVVTCLEGVIDKLEFSVEVVPLALEAVALVVNLMIAFDLCKRVPALLVCHCFVEGVEGSPLSQHWTHLVFL